MHCALLSLSKVTFKLLPNPSRSLKEFAIPTYNMLQLSHSSKHQVNYKQEHLHCSHFHLYTPPTYSTAFLTTLPKNKLNRHNNKLYYQGHVMYSHSSIFVFTFVSYSFTLGYPDLSCALTGKSDTLYILCMLHSDLSVEPRMYMYVVII